jgi:hypothetical protein
VIKSSGLNRHLGRQEVPLPTYPGDLMKTISRSWYADACEDQTGPRKDTDGGGPGEPASKQEKTRRIRYSVGGRVSKV